MTFRKINELWSTWADAYADWDDEKLELFGQYLLYLRNLSKANTNDGAQSVLGVKNVRTFQRILKGQRVEEDTASNTMQHFSKKMTYDKEQKRKAKHGGGGGGPNGGGHKGKFKKKKAH